MYDRRKFFTPQVNMKNLPGLFILIFGIGVGAGFFFLVSGLRGMKADEEFKNLESQVELLKTRSDILRLKVDELDSLNAELMKILEFLPDAASEN